MSYQRKRSVSVNDRGHVIGQDHHRSRLADHEIDLIRELRDGGMKIADIAQKFEITKGMASDYCTGKRRAQIAVNQRFIKDSAPRFRPARPGDFDEFA